MKIRYFLMALCASALLAQTAPEPPKPTFDAVKAALGLRDEQVTQLVDLRKQEREALRPILQQVSEKGKTLRDTLQTGTADAVTVGNLVLGIQTLRKQAQDTRTSFHNQALGVLDAQQKANLAKLEEAMKARPAIGQAVGLNLLEGPAAVKPGLGPGAGLALGPAQMLRLGMARQALRQRLGRTL